MDSAWLIEVALENLENLGSGKFGVRSFVIAFPSPRHWGSGLANQHFEFLLTTN